MHVNALTVHLECGYPALGEGSVGMKCYYLPPCLVLTFDGQTFGRAINKRNLNVV